MSLSKRSVEILLDLVEIKLSHMNISDHEDARDLHTLKCCRTELQAQMSQKPVALDGPALGDAPAAAASRRKCRSKAASATRSRG